MRREFQKMKKPATLPSSIIACVDKRDGRVLKVGTVSGMIASAIVDPHHVMLGAGCGDWGVCMYLTLADAARLNAELDQLITDQTERG
jgi:hypothetical protein